MSGDQWNPTRYERFASDRERPFWDLAALLHRADAPRLADLGCGTGRLTAELAARLGASGTLGVDSGLAAVDGVVSTTRSPFANCDTSSKLIGVAPVTVAWASIAWDEVSA